MVRMGDICQALDDLWLEGKELVKDDGLWENVRHDSNGKDADGQQLAPTVGVANSGGDSDATQQLELMLFWNLIVLN